MAISPQNHARALELAKELNEINGGRYHDDGRPKTFDELEIETNALTDLLSSMAQTASAKDLPDEEKPVRCPPMQAVSKPHDPDNDESMVISLDWLLEEAQQRNMPHGRFTRVIAKSLAHTAIRKFERNFPDGAPEPDDDVNLEDADLHPPRASALQQVEDDSFSAIQSSLPRSSSVRR